MPTRPTKSENKPAKDQAAMTKGVKANAGRTRSERSGSVAAKSAVKAPAKRAGVASAQTKAAKVAHTKAAKATMSAGVKRVKARPAAAPKKRSSQEAQQQQNDVICLAENLGISDAVKLCAELADLSVNKKPVCVDASKVVRIDTAILQVLVASAIAGRFSGRPLTWAGTSEVVLANARCLGLTTELGLPKQGLPKQGFPKQGLSR